MRVGEIYHYIGSDVKLRGCKFYLYDFDNEKVIVKYKLKKVFRFIRLSRDDFKCLYIRVRLAQQPIMETE